MEFQQNPLEGNEHYEMIKFIGSGACGTVALAKEKQTGIQYALKFIRRGFQYDAKYVEREVSAGIVDSIILNLMRLRSHPHVVALHDVFLAKQDLVLVLGHAAGGNLLGVVGNDGLTEADARWYFQQIIVAIDYCHRLGICSRDIKLENVLLDGSTKRLVKLCDFGFSKYEDYDSLPQTRLGTLNYFAPEVISADQSRPYNGSAVDIWSCGVLLYVMVCGSFPFSRSTDGAMKGAYRQDLVQKRIKAVDYSFPDDRPLTPECKDLIGRLLVKEPAQRATLLDVMRHPWFTVGLSPAVLAFNDTLLANSNGADLSPDLVDLVSNIVRQAAEKPGGHGATATGLWASATFSLDPDSLLAHSSQQG